MKRIILMGLSLLFLVVLSSCKLAPDEEIIIEENDKKLIGFYIQIVDFSEGLGTRLLPEYGEVDAVYMIDWIEVDEDGYSTQFNETSPSFLNVKSNTHIHDNIVNDIKTRTITITSDIEILLGIEHEDHVLYIDPIYEGDDTPSDDGSYGHMLSRGQTTTSTFEDEYIKNEVIYKVSFKISHKIVDEVTHVNFIEMNENHQIVKETTLYEPIETLNLQESTAYVIIEEHFINGGNEPYIVRRVHEENQTSFEQLHFLNVYGFVSRESGISLLFS